MKWQYAPGELGKAYGREKEWKAKIRVYALWKMPEGNAAKSIAKSMRYSYDAVLGLLLSTATMVRRVRTEGKLLQRSLKALTE